MQENVLLVQKGFRILVASMSGFIGQKMSKEYKDKWWDEVLFRLSDQKDLPYFGSYTELVDSLDIANCIRLIDREWNDLFRYELPFNCRTWSKELMDVRNTVSHIGMRDIEQSYAERALDTMALLCKEMDPDGAEEIREIYKEVRQRAEGSQPVTIEHIEYKGAEQPVSESKRGALGDGSLLQLEGTDSVIKTTLSRKVTYGGKTTVYPVYQVRLDKLYYNDQNDRIATWISKYETEHGTGSLSGLDVNEYNDIIESFIYDSNPDSIRKTQKNISLVGQREPGVTLADGRVVDGNRRFTCLRRISKETKDPVYFETVIMDMDIREDKKQIKLLELSIQHGEEKKVDYDLVDYVIGTYRDIVETKLLTIDEYAQSANETLGEVKKRLEIAKLICEFLDYAGLSGQYHIAREYQVYNIFAEMLAPLKQLDDEGKEILKKIVFNNLMLKAIPDQRKFIRDIKHLVKSGAYRTYFDEQDKISSAIQDTYVPVEMKTKADVDRYAEEHKKIAEDLQESMETALQKSRLQIVKEKPSDDVSKCISIMLGIDSRLFTRLDDEEKASLKSGLDEIIKLSNNFKNQL